MYTDLCNKLSSMFLKTIKFIFTGACLHNTRIVCIIMNKYIVALDIVCLIDLLIYRECLCRCFPVNFAKFLRTRFYRTPPDDCFWMCCFQDQFSSMNTPKNFVACSFFICVSLIRRLGVEVTVFLRENEITTI